MDLGGRALVFVLGGPGSGKGTQCVRLKEEFNLTHLSAGDLLRAEVATGSVLGAELNRIMAEGQLVPMSVTINLLRTSIQSSLDANPSTSGFLVDGFPRELDQATAFERATSLVPDFILFFDCPLATLEQRLLKRGETSGRADDNLAAIQKRFKTFTDQSVPVVDHYRGRGKVLEISSVLAVDTVYAVTRGKVLERVEGWRPKDGVDLKGRPLIFVLGGPGSGKGTQCAKIRELYTLAHLSVGDLLRDEVATGSDLGRRVNEYMKEGAIVPLEVTLSVVKRAVEAVDGTASGFLIDGFPREITQAVEWERKMCTPSLVLFYDCPLPLLESRLLKRGETSGRADDNLASIQKRFKTFHDTSMPVVDYYRALGKVATISSDASVESVLETTCRAIDSHRWETDHGQHALKRLVFENVVFVLGGPGSGKGTQCDRLVEHFKYVHLSTGDLLRAEVANGSPIGKQAEAIMKDGGMVPIDMIRTLLLMGMRASPGAPGYLVDGYPRTLEQAQDIVMILPPRCVLYYDCPAETLVGRLLKRGETSGRADDNAESIKKRIDTFHATTVPVVDFFDARGVVCKVDATRSVDDITADTMAAFKAWS
ncbi:adenylate kinase-domain-containing protein [Blastocladiella britannica]|nr:adenylate kinase-domain-containing protein [Blastocladiella britannica]